MRKIVLFLTVLVASSLAFGESYVFPMDTEVTEPIYPSRCQLSGETSYSHINAEIQTYTSNGEVMFSVVEVAINTEGGASRSDSFIYQGLDATMTRGQKSLIDQVTNNVLGFELLKEGVNSLSNRQVVEGIFNAECADPGMG